MGLPATRTGAGKTSVGSRLTFPTKPRPSAAKEKEEAELRVVGNGRGKSQTAGPQCTEGLCPVPQHPRKHFLSYLRPNHCRTHLKIKSISERHSLAAVTSIQIHPCPYTQNFTHSYSYSHNSIIQKIGRIKKEQKSSLL